MEAETEAVEAWAKEAEGRAEAAAEATTAREAATRVSEVVGSAPTEGVRALEAVATASAEDPTAAAARRRWPRLRRAAS